MKKIDQIDHEYLKLVVAAHLIGYLREEIKDSDVSYLEVTWKTIEDITDMSVDIYMHVVIPSEIIHAVILEDDEYDAYDKYRDEAYVLAHAEVEYQIRRMFENTINQLSNV